MAFVFKSEKQPTYIPKNGNEQIGPGSYQADVTELPEIIRNTRPFNTTADRHHNAYNQRNTPGPGSYDLQSSFECQKVIFQSDEQEIKILEVPKPISVFRSTTVRFKEAKTQGPGPTTYQLEDKRRFHSSETRKRKANVIEKIMRDNKYISIPSIPSGIHQLGYTELPNNQLEPNERFINDDVGPGSYEMKSSFQNPRPKGVSWHKPSSKEKQNSSVGPGEYDITATSVPMYQMKPQTAFSSKCGRYTDFKFHQSKWNTSFIKKGLDNKQYSFQLSTKEGTMRDSDEESDYSYIEDATPGPGYYENASVNHTIASICQKNQNKGSLKSQTKRFQRPKHLYPGPGEYNLDYVHNKMQGPQPPFMSQQIRLKSKSAHDGPAPNFYKASFTIEENLVNKLLKAPLGSFGVNEPRFQEKQDKFPGPGTYDIKPIQNSKYKGTAAFKSQVNKIEEIASQNISPPPGAYDVNQYTIANKLLKQEEDDPKLAVIKPPFGSGEERWKCANTIKEEEEDDYPLLEKSPQNLYQKKMKQMPPFMSSEQRFQERQDQLPGPSEYADGTFPNWNKRTFNIIFAEI